MRFECVPPSGMRIPGGMICNVFRIRRIILIVTILLIIIIGLLIIATMLLFFETCVPEFVPLTRSGARDPGCAFCAGHGEYPSHRSWQYF